jgi:DNA-binding MarR family transcriptional regulator
MAQSCLGRRVGHLHRLVSRRFDESLRPLGLTGPQVEILAALTMAAAPVKPSAAAQWLGMERSTMSRNLAVLEERGWVAPGEISPTGRTMKVVITEEGGRKLAGAAEAWTDAQGAVERALGIGSAGALDAWIGEMSGC